MMMLAKSWFWMTEFANAERRQDDERRGEKAFLMMTFTDDAPL